MPIIGSGGPRPMPPFQNMMVFIDGENLVMRFQEMCKQHTKKDTVYHHPDIFVWERGAIKPDLHNVVRATYYTYVVGTEDKILEESEIIKSLEFNKHPDSPMPNYLQPCIFKKPSKGAKAKGVDIQLTVDILIHTYQNNLDAVYLISGDGDYFPVIQEVVRKGKQVYLAALSSGLNPKLKTSVDVFIDLDSVFFK